MNWKDKATEIASGIMSKCGVKSSVTLSDGNLRALLEDAAMQGMKHELDAWLNRPKKINDNGLEQRVEQV